MNILQPDRKLAILTALTEGCSIRSVSCMTGAHIETILKLLVETGARAQAMLDEKMRGIHAEAIECDELWCYIGKKQRNLTFEDQVNNPEYGDCYTFIAFDPMTKVVPVFTVGKRDTWTTEEFINELRARVVGRPQISTDGYLPYKSAISEAFGSEVDYAQIVKVYAAQNPGPGRYSPPKVTGVEVTDILGRPQRNRVSTSYVERNNLTIRMHLRRFTRLTNAFSRKLENLKAALSLHFWWWNFCWRPRTIRVTPAMQAGITERVWELRELVT